MDIKTATIDEISKHWSLKEEDAIHRYIKGEVEASEIEDIVATSIFWLFARYEYRETAKKSLSGIRRD